MIVKEGQLKITIAGKSKTLGPGSIAFVMPVINIWQTMPATPMPLFLY
jgi:hypothetical protein